MHRYFSTFITGFEKLISKLMTDDIPNLKNTVIYPGAVIYDTPADASFISTLRYFNNTFAVLKEFTFENIPTSSNLVDCAEQIASNKSITVPQPLASDFKIFSSLENHLTGLPGKIMHGLVSRCEKLLGIPYNPKSKSFELWLMLRREKFGIFGLRLTKNKKKTAAGELRPELAHLLCRLSDPNPNDVFCDPFCGSGTIALERSRLPFKGIFASDKNQELTTSLKQKISKIKSAKLAKSFFIKTGDFFELSFTSGFFTRIVSDPPWGVFASIEPDFYPRLLEKCEHILSPRGKMIILTSSPNILKKEKTKT